MLLANICNTETVKKNGAYECNTTQQEMRHRWKKEYLRELQERTKWKVAQENVQQNVLVVIRHEPLCPTEWRLGHVTKMFHGSDNHVHFAGLRTQNDTIKKPIHKMVLLPRAS